MAKRAPEEDPRVTDLSRYRKARAAAERKRARPPRPTGEGFLGANPRASVILVLLILAALAMWLAPRLLH